MSRWRTKLAQRIEKILERNAGDLDTGPMADAIARSLKKDLIELDNGHWRCRLCRDSWAKGDPMHHDRACLLREVEP